MKQYIDKGLNFLRHPQVLKIFELGETWAERIGLICMYFVVPALGVIICLRHWKAIDTLIASPLLVMLAVVIASVVMGYIAEKMLEYVKPSIEQAKTSIVNGAFFDVLAFLFVIGALVTGACTLGALFDAGIMTAFPILIAFVLSLYFAVMLLSSEKMLNVRVQSSATPAQSLIAISALLVKAMYRIVPFAFGALMIFAVITEVESVFVSSWKFMALSSSFTEIVLAAALLPLLSYLSFLLYYFAIDFFAAFFHIAESVGKSSDKTPNKAK